MSATWLAPIAATLRRALPALGSYYTIALGIPIVNENRVPRGLLTEHALFVLIVPVLLLSLLGAFRAVFQVALAPLRAFGRSRRWRSRRT